MARNLRRITVNDGVQSAPCVIIRGRMKKLGFALAGITAMLIGGQANATVCGSTIMLPSGDGV